MFVCHVFGSWLLRLVQQATESVGIKTLRRLWFFFSEINYHSNEQAQILHQTFGMNACDVLRKKLKKKI